MSRWTNRDDQRLLKLVQYIYHHASDRQIGLIGDDLQNISVQLFTDADFAGDAMTQRSTSGIHLALHGERTIFPLQGLSAKQEAVAFSTPEAEIYAGCMGYRKVMLPALQLWDVIGPQMDVPMFHEDNQAVVLIVMSGRNPTMRHLGRVHRISVQWMHENLGKHPNRDKTIMFYQDTKNMSADIYIYIYIQRGLGQGTSGTMHSTLLTSFTATNCLLSFYQTGLTSERMSTDQLNLSATKKRS